MNLKLAETIRRLRKERGMTQNELADRLGVSYQAVSRWENESSYPDIKLLPAIAALFGITVDYLLGSGEKRAGREWWDSCYQSDDPVERLAHLRRMHRTFPEDQEVFFRLCEAVTDPEEALRLSEEFLEKCTIPFFRSAIIKHMVTVLDEDRVMHYIWAKNIPEEAWDSLLEERYLARGEMDAYHQKRQYLLGEHLRQAFFRLENYDGFSDMSNFEGYPGTVRAMCVDVDGAKTVLAVIAALTNTRLTGKHPVAGNGAPDLWYSQRIWAALHIASGLSATGNGKQMGEAIRYLEDAADLLRRLRRLPAQAILSYRTHGLDTRDQPRSRCILYYDRYQMEQFFSAPSFHTLRADPVYSLRFAVSCAVFYENPAHSDDHPVA